MQEIPQIAERTRKPKYEVPLVVLVLLVHTRGKMKRSYSTNSILYPKHRAIPRMELANL